MPDGKEVEIRHDLSRAEGLALLGEYKDCYTMEGMLAEAR